MTQATLNRRYYKRIGYCPRCNGKNKLFGDEKSCPECRARETERTLKARDAKRYNKYHAKWSKNTYYSRKEKGLCTRCGKYPAKKGQLRCEYCIIKDSATRQIREYQLSRFERGLCRWCDNPVEPGYKVCEFHHQQNIERAVKANAERKGVSNSKQYRREA